MFNNLHPKAFFYITVMFFFLPSGEIWWVLPFITITSWLTTMLNGYCVHQMMKFCHYTCKEEKTTHTHTYWMWWGLQVRTQPWCNPEHSHTEVGEMHTVVNTITVPSSFAFMCLMTDSTYLFFSSWYFSSIFSIFNSANLDTTDTHTFTIQLLADILKRNIKS